MRVCMALVKFTAFELFNSHVARKQRARFQLLGSYSAKIFRPHFSGVDARCRLNEINEGNFSKFRLMPAPRHYPYFNVPERSREAREKRSTAGIRGDCTFAREIGSVNRNCVRRIRSGDEPRDCIFLI
jgi:hypothetical protein